MDIDINTFISVFKNKETKEDKMEFLGEHIKNVYIPYEKKADTANAIVRNCYWKKQEDENGNEVSVFYINSVAKYMLTYMALVDLYTDIDRSKNNSKMLDDFNSLNSLGILDMLTELIDQRELKEFNMILQMTSDDVMTNEYENHAFISKQVERFKNIFELVLSKVDFEQVQKVIDQFK